MPRFSPARDRTMRLFASGFVQDAENTLKSPNVVPASGQQ